MTPETHNPGIHANFLVTRRLQLKGLDNGGFDPLLAQLNALPEVDAASIRMTGNGALLEIRYDASTRPQPLDHIQQALASQGAELATEWWTRFKQRYYTVTDQNIYANARYEPSCCSKVPPGK